MVEGCVANALVLQLHILTRVTFIIVFLQVARLGEPLVAEVALVWLASIVEPEVVKDVAALLEPPVAPINFADEE